MHHRLMVINKILQVSSIQTIGWLCVEVLLEFFCYDILLTNFTDIHLTDLK